MTILSVLVGQGETFRVILQIIWPLAITGLHGDNSNYTWKLDTSVVLIPFVVLYECFKEESNVLLYEYFQIYRINVLEISCYSIFLMVH